jgi:hypothetical protein
MKRTLGMLSLAALLAAGGVALAQKGGGNDSGQQSPASSPATGSAATSPTYQQGSGASAQSTGTYPGGVGPTGSRQPDATNPVRSNPSGGGWD